MASAPEGIELVELLSYRQQVLTAVAVDDPARPLHLLSSAAALEELYR